jgi:hypothetical protein
MSSYPGLQPARAAQQDSAPKQAIIDEATKADKELVDHFAQQRVPVLEKVAHHPSASTGAGWRKISMPSSVSRRAGWDASVGQMDGTYQSDK